MTLSPCLEEDAPFVSVYVGQSDSEAIGGQEVLDPVGPLDNADLVSIQIVIPPHICQLVDVIQPVEVEVIQAQRIAVLTVFVYQGESGADDPVAESHSLAHTLAETCFACSQFALQTEQVAFLCQLSQVGSDALGLIGTTADELNISFV